MVKPELVHRQWQTSRHGILIFYGKLFKLQSCNIKYLVDLITNTISGSVDIGLILLVHREAKSKPQLNGNGWDLQGGGRNSIRGIGKLMLAFGI